MKKQDWSKIKRPKYKIPSFVKKELIDGKVMDKYKQRPPYQQNDYIGWINNAKLHATKAKRTNQMISELKKGNVYMKMKWTGK